MKRAGMATDSDDADFGEFSSAFPSTGNGSGTLATYTELIHDNMASDTVCMAGAGVNYDLDLKLDFPDFSLEPAISEHQEPLKNISADGGQVLQPVFTDTNSTQSQSGFISELQPCTYVNVDSPQNPELMGSAYSSSELPTFHSAHEFPSTSEKVWAVISYSNCLLGTSPLLQ